MSDWFSSIDVPWWFLGLLAIGVVDALIQLSDYLRWRKERRDSDDVSD